MPVKLVIKTEFIAVTADLVNAAIDPSGRRTVVFQHFFRSKAFAISREEGINAQHVFQIGNKKLLMLLLMIEAEDDKIANVFRYWSGQELAHFFIHILPEF